MYSHCPQSRQRTRLHGSRCSGSARPIGAEHHARTLQAQMWVLRLARALPVGKVAKLTQI